MKIAVIPARGGSKRIPRKNIKLFSGKPMIGWSIEAAKSSGCFDEIIVSTDDEEIAAVARRWGASVPFIRPASLSDDHTGTTAVIRHSLEWLDSKNTTVTHACCVYATAPFLNPEDIKRGLELIENLDLDYAFSVTSYSFPIQRALKLDANDRVNMFNPEHLKTRSQDLTVAWHDAGQFYWGTKSAWLREAAIYSERAAVVKLPRHRVQDIDVQEDWERAEWLFKAMCMESSKIES